jgi:hypothetical protein
LCLRFFLVKRHKTFFGFGFKSFFLDWLYFFFGFGFWLCARNSLYFVFGFGFFYIFYYARKLLLLRQPRLTAWHPPILFGLPHFIWPLLFFLFWSPPFFSQ